MVNGGRWKKQGLSRPPRVRKVLGEWERGGQDGGWRWGETRTGAGCGAACCQPLDVRKAERSGLSAAPLRRSAAHHSAWGSPPRPLPPPPVFQGLPGFAEAHSASARPEEPRAEAAVKRPVRILLKVQHQYI